MSKGHAQARERATCPGREGYMPRG